MTRSARTAALVASLVMAAASWGYLTADDWQDDWLNWRYSRAVDLGPGVEARFASVEIPPEVYRNADRTLADLRVVDGDGRETPYVVRMKTGKHTTEWLDAGVIDTGIVPGRYTQAVVDTGTNGEVHNRVEIETAVRDFFARVEVAASDDRATWRILETGLPIYRFSTEGLAGDRTVRYPDTRSRWLRLRVMATEVEVPISGVRLSRETVEKAERNAYGGTIAPLTDAPERESGWLVEFDGAALPLSEIRFETAAAAFHRPVRIEYSNARDAEHWSHAASGNIYRFPAEGPRRGRESLSFEFGETQARYWRVYVVNRDDPPIADLKFTLYGVPRHVVFQPAAGQSYNFVYGNRVAPAPQYELARLIAEDALASAAPVRVGDEVENARYVDPAPPPWSEQNRYVLWFGLLIAVGVLGWLAMTSMRQTPRKED